MMLLNTWIVCMRSQYVLLLLSMRFVLSSKSISVCLLVSSCFLLTTSNRNSWSLLRSISLLLANKCVSNVNPLITTKSSSVSLHSKTSFVLNASCN